MVRWPVGGVQGVMSVPNGTGFIYEYTVEKSQIYDMGTSTLGLGYQASVTRVELGNRRWQCGKDGQSTRCGSPSIQRWQTLVGSASKNLGRKLQSILDSVTGRSRQGKRLTLKTKTKSRTTWHCRRTEGNLNTKQFDCVVEKFKKRDSVTDGRSQHISHRKSHVHPPHSHSIIYIGTGSLI